MFFYNKVFGWTPGATSSYETITTAPIPSGAGAPGGGFTDTASGELGSSPGLNIYFQVDNVTLSIRAAWDAAQQLGRTINILQPRTPHPENPSKWFYGAFEDWDGIRVFLLEINP